MAFCYNYQWEDLPNDIRKRLGNRKNYFRFLGIARELYLKAYLFNFAMM